ncbi:MAG: hypothetical protein ACK4S2_11480 [Gemmobacter sp.]
MMRFRAGTVHRPRHARCLACNGFVAAAQRNPPPAPGDIQQIFADCCQKPEDRPPEGLVGESNHAITLGHLGMQQKRNDRAHAVCHRVRLAGTGEQE